MKNIHLHTDNKLRVEKQRPYKICEIKNYTSPDHSSQVMQEQRAMPEPHVTTTWRKPQVIAATTTSVVTEDQKDMSCYQPSLLI